MNEYKITKKDGYDGTSDNIENLFATSVNITYNGDLVFMEGSELKKAIAVGNWDTVELV